MSKSRQRVHATFTSQMKKIPSRRNQGSDTRVRTQKNIIIVYYIIVYYFTYFILLVQKTQ